jgi:hypothetical protein
VGHQECVPRRICAHVHPPLHVWTRLAIAPSEAAGHPKQCARDPCLLSCPSSWSLPLNHSRVKHELLGLRNLGQACD